MLSFLGIFFTFLIAMAARRSVLMAKATAEATMAA
jgi:hypothetical protein